MYALNRATGFRPSSSTCLPLGGKFVLGREEEDEKVFSGSNPDTLTAEAENRSVAYHECSKALGTSANIHGSVCEENR